MNWGVVVRRVQMSVSIWDTVCSHPVKGWDWDLNRADVRDPWKDVQERVCLLCAELSRLDALKDRKIACIVRRHPVTDRRTSLMTASMWRVWALRHQTGAQCSAVEWTRTKVGVFHPAQVSKLLQECDAWCQLCVKWLEVSTIHERPGQRYSEVGKRAVFRMWNWFSAHV